LFPRLEDTTGTKRLPTGGAPAVHQAPTENHKIMETIAKGSRKTEVGGGEGVGGCSLQPSTKHR